MPDPVPAPEQQGEPVCARCDHASHERGCGVPLPAFGEGAECGCFNRSQPDDRPRCRTCGETYQGWTVSDGVRTYQACATPVEGGTYATHPFEQPAPPSSEEAEARRVNTRGENSRGLWPGSTWLVHNAMGEPVELFVPAPIEAAIRAPLEERVRELEALQEIIDSNGHYCDGMALAWSDAQSATGEAARQQARAQALEEERDRLRALYDEACAAMDVLALHSAPRARAEAAEAQVQELRAALEWMVENSESEESAPPEIGRTLRALAAQQEGGGDEVNTPQEEAERRWPDRARAQDSLVTLRYGFVRGAEWLAGEIGLTVEQVQRLGPLVEAAREYRNEARRTLWDHVRYDAAVMNLLAAAAALDGWTEAERPPESSSTARRPLL